ncbi:MAG TPA: universal stress protein [Gemmatimonadaceae bacterium]
MTSPVVVALDGSAKDARGLAVGAAFAELAGATLHLARVVPEGDEPAAAEAARALAEMADRVRPTLGDAASVEVLHGDDAAAALVRHAAERAPLLVVMATRAAGAAERAIRGSVADRVMRECPRPVLLVPPGTEDMAGRHVHLSRVLVPLDGSALGERALDYALRLPHGAELEYALLEVLGADRERPAALARLEAAERRARGAGATAVESDVVTAKDAAAAIVESVRDALADVIVMSSRGAGGLRRLVLGSVAEGVVRRSDVPVLLLTPASLASR